jgi:hypothetical protein
MSKLTEKLSESDEHREAGRHAVSQRIAALAFRSGPSRVPNEASVLLAGGNWRFWIIEAFGPDSTRTLPRQKRAWKAIHKPLILLEFIGSQL